MISAERDSGDTIGSSFELEIERIFSADGRLSAASNYRISCPSSSAWACQVARTLQSGGHLVVEAGTELENRWPISFRPPPARCGRNARRVISTHTIALQEQLMLRIFSLVQKLLPIEFEAALFERASQFSLRLPGSSAPQPGERPLHFRATQRTRANSGTGVSRQGMARLAISRCSPNLRFGREVRSEPHVCTPKTCAKIRAAFISAMRRRVLAADLVVLNHALFFTLLGSMRRGTRRWNSFREGFRHF